MHMKMTYLVVAVSLFFTILTGKCDKTNAGNPLVRHWAVEPMSDIMRLPDKEPEDGDLGGDPAQIAAKRVCLA